MLRIVIPEGQLFDEKTEEFIYTKQQTLQLEHSLVSLSKWESKWHKPFLGKDDKSLEETIDYIKCMTLTPNIDPNVYKFLTKENIKDINDYIGDSMTATTFNDINLKGRSRETITSELIYYWMVSFNIPFECQKWHINRLITLIRICIIKNQSSKKMSKSEIMSRNASINAARRKQLNSKG